MEVVEILFRSHEGRSPGKIKWTNLLHLMQAMGYKAEKGYGAIWKFEPAVDDGLLQPTNIHDDHRSYLNIRTAWSIGKRFNKSYGWDADSFKLAS